MKTEESIDSNALNALAFPKRERKRVLLIAEHSSTRPAVVKGLETAGLEVDLATDGEVAMRKVRAGQPPDAVFLDLPLSNIDALEVIKEARRQFASRPIYVCDRGFLMGRRTRRAMKAGATKVFDKAATTIDRILAEVTARLAADGGGAKPPQPTDTPVPASATPEAKSATRQPGPEQFEELVATLRKQVQLLGQVSDNAGRTGGFEMAQNVTQALVSCATTDGMRRIALLGAALQAFFKELREKPNQVMASSLSTITLAVDVLGLLARESGASQEAPLSKFVATVADKDPISSRATQNALANAGFEPRIFADPGLALSYLEANPVDLVVLDVMIAGQSGSNLYEKLRQLPRHTQTPVIFIANSSDPKFSANLQSSFQTQFLAKPQNMTHYLELALKALSRVLKHHAQNRAAAPPAGSQATPPPTPPLVMSPAPEGSTTLRRAKVVSQQAKPEKPPRESETRVMNVPVSEAKAASARPQPSDARGQTAHDELPQKFQAASAEVATLRETLTGKEKECGELAGKVASSQNELAQVRTALAQESEARQQLEQKLQSIWGGKTKAEPEAATELKRRNQELEKLLSERAGELERLKAERAKEADEQRRLASEAGGKLDAAKAAAEKAEAARKEEAARRNQELEKLLSEGTGELERLKAERAKEADEQRRLASEASGKLDAAKAAAEKAEAVRKEEAARSKSLEEALASLRQAHKELETKAAAAEAQAAAESLRRKEEAERPRHDTDIDPEAGLSEPGRRIPQAVASLARVTAELENERNERRRSEQRAGTLATQSQELHEQLRQHLESVTLSQTRISALENQLRQHEERIARLSADLEKETKEHQLAEEQLRASGAISTQLQSCLSAFDQARKSFKRRQDELDLQLQGNQNTLAESQARLEKEILERKRAEEALGALQRNLQEQSQKSAGELSKLQSELSRLQSALDVEQAERRRLEGDAIQSRYGSLDSARVGLTTVNRFRKEMREPVDHLMQSTRRLLEVRLEEQHKLLVESMLEDTLMLQTSLHEAGRLQGDSLGSGGAAGPELNQAQPPGPVSAPAGGKTQP